MSEGVKYGMNFFTGKAGKTLICTLVLASLLAASCGGPINPRERKLEEHYYFFNMLPEERHAAFDIYPVDLQFELYIVLMTMEGPPDTEYAVSIAAKRSQVVPFLIKMLRQESYRGFPSNRDNVENIKEKTIFIFRVMQRYDYHDVKHDKRAIKAIQDTIAEMENPLYRQLSIGYLEQILAEE